MKCLGLIGGIGWESTAVYYRTINEEARNRFGSLHSARIIVNSLEFEALNHLAHGGKWNEAGAVVCAAARALERAGSEGLLMCSNLMHHVARQVEASVSIPLLHIGDAILEELRAQGIADVGLLGTRFTLEHGFLLDRPQRTQRWGRARIYIPTDEDRERLDRIIYGELCRGLVRAGTREALLRMCRDLRAQGAKAVVLASTELATALRPEDFAGHLYDSAELHALRAARWSMDEERKIDFSHFRMSSVPGGRPAKAR